MLAVATDYDEPGEMLGKGDRALMSVGRRLQAVGGCLGALSVLALLYASPAAAQAVSTGAEANETVQLVKSALIGIAIALLVLTIFYWIHTDPRRRARAHAKRSARDEAFAAERSTKLADAHPDDLDDLDEGVLASDATGPILLIADDADVLEALDDLEATEHAEDTEYADDLEREVS